MAQRSIQTTLQRIRSLHDGKEDDDESEDDDQSDGDEEIVNRQRGKSDQNHRKSPKGNTVDSELMKLLKEQSEAIKALKGQIDTLQIDRVTEARRTKLKKLLENTGTFGKSVMKQFDLMEFKDNDAFDDYLDEVQKDLEELNQERANEGLKKLGEVPAGKRNKNPEDQEIDAMSDEDIISLAGGKKEQN